LIARAQSGDATATATVKEHGIDPGSLDRVIRLSVTLDDLSVLSAAEAEFKKVGWVPPDHDLAPTLLIADLVCVVDILDNPLLLLHYLSERAHFQKAFNLVGDELDFLGLYLETGFNLGVPKEQMLFAPSGMSERIDRYYTNRDAKFTHSKPKPNLSPLFRRIIDRLNERRSKGWTTVGLHLLGAGGPPEQRKLDRLLDKVRIGVRKNYRDPDRINTVWIRPPQKHKAKVGFYLFPEQLRAEHKKTMEKLSSDALDADDGAAVVLFGRSTETWDVPYETILYAKKH
jgi:hypothetical protein